MFLTSLVYFLGLFWHPDDDFLISPNTIVPISAILICEKKWKFESRFVDPWDLILTLVGINFLDQ